MIQYVIFAPVRGFFYFLTSPRLWVRPIVATLLGSLALGFVFWIFTFSFWPTEINSDWKYVWHSFKAIGLAALITMLVWMFIMPFFFGLAFDGVVERVLVNEKFGTEREISYISSITTGFLLMIKTMKWRLFWPILTLLCFFFLPFLTVVVASLGMGHSAVIDATGIVLAFFGYSVDDRVVFLKKHSGKLFWMGIAGGIGYIILIPVLFLWLFWIPGIFVGAALWLGDFLKKSKA